MQLSKLLIVLAFVSPQLFANVEALGLRTDHNQEGQINRGIPYFNGRPYIDLQNEGDDALDMDRSVVDKGYTLEVLEESFFFGKDSTRLSNDHKRRLDDIARSIKSDKGVRSVRILGFSDSDGNHQQNQRMSQRRADAVANYLSSKGVNVNVESKGLGELSTLRSSDARRVDMTIESEMYSE